MDLLLNEDETLIRESARTFLAAECNTKLVRAMEKDPQGYPPDLWSRITALGWPGMAVPEAYGGMPMSLSALGLILEEVGRALAPVPLLSTVVPALILADHADEALKQAVLPGVAGDGTILTWAFAEHAPRLSEQSIQMRAVADGADYVLSGHKLFVDNFAAARHCLVTCRTGAQDAPGGGLSLFLVDTDSAGLRDIPLVTIAKDRQSELVFDRVRVPAARLVGRLNHAGPLAQRMLDLATVLLCAQMLGAARKDAEMAFDYAKFRVAFGQPIGAFQSIQHMCADMLMALDGGGLLTYEALWMLDQGLPAQVEISQAKAFCNEKCEAVVRSSQIIHGGIGFTMELDLHLWYRRVTAWTMRLGTAYEHRARVARALLDPPGCVMLGDPLPALV